MRQEKENKTKWLHIRLTPEEYRKIQSFRSNTTSKKLSDYARRIILAKPVTTYQRDQSLDEFMAELIKLRNELNAIGNNFNQAVHRLHLLQTVQDYRTWVSMNERTKDLLFEKIDEIKNRINQFSDKWLQDSTRTKA